MAKRTIKLIHPSSDVQSKNIGEIIVEDDVFIGLNATILPGVTIGKNAMIGAGSIITKEEVLNNMIFIASASRESKKRVTERQFLNLTFKLPFRKRGYA